MEKDYRRTIEEFLGQVRHAIGGDWSAVLYGSAARGDYVQGHSDVNVLLILDDVDADRLTRLTPALEVWDEADLAPPLLMSSAEWSRAVDVFPIEVTDIQHAYEVLEGVDPVAGLSADPGHLRRALECELRGKLLRLRQGYVANVGNPEDLGALAIGSLRMVLVLFRSLLALAGRTVPRSAEAVVTETAGLVGFAPNSVHDIIAHRADEGWRWSGAHFAEYLDAIERSVHFADTYDTGVR